jgi:hypothetical protein
MHLAQHLPGIGVRSRLLECSQAAFADPAGGAGCLHGEGQCVDEVGRAHPRRVAQLPGCRYGDLRRRPRQVPVAEVAQQHRRLVGDPDQRVGTRVGGGIAQQARQQGRESEVLAALPQLHGVLDGGGHLLRAARRRLDLAYVQGDEGDADTRYSPRRLNAHRIGGVGVLAEQVSSRHLECLRQGDQEATRFDAAHPGLDLAEVALGYAGQPGEGGLGQLATTTPDADSAADVLGHLVLPGCGQGEGGRPHNRPP